MRSQTRDAVLSKVNLDFQSPSTWHREVTRANRALKIQGVDVTIFA